MDPDGLMIHSKRSFVSSTVKQNNDGKLDEVDAQAHWESAQTMLTNKVPSAGGFSAGFLLGARRG